MYTNEKENVCKLWNSKYSTLTPKRSRANYKVYSCCTYVIGLEKKKYRYSMTYLTSQKNT